MSTLKLYGLLVRASIRSRMQYKFNFVFSTLMAACVSAAEILMVAFVLMKFGHVKDWSFYEVGYLYAVIMLSKAIYRTFASDVHHLEKYLVSGDLDALLIRPIPLLLALMTQNVRLLVAEFGQGILILFISMRALISSGQIDWVAIPQTLLIVLSGSVILFSIGLATSAIGFWTTRVEELQTLTEDAARTAAQYPLVLYPKWMSTVLLVLIPVGFVNYIPSLFILRNEYGSWLLLSVVGVAAVCCMLALLFWRIGISRYQSTGS
ncbi:ABC transporter permease [Paenibacillus eucommiae]|uniref:ABC-2 type transport system permease protein n=1 Tax=Paenibacillus eucommiae TaxID=1355755 RepID=A0ABS4IY10_9BACL|nr:ABC-2 family transporter protein [Paenibacillus eucommiae]MBP1992413.1 ABC-2 type transport system permease protein [Paenibacillus eucommiae]